MLLECQICGAEEFTGKCTKCDHVRGVFREIKERSRELEVENRILKDGITVFLRETSNREVIVEDKERLYKLLSANWRSAESYEQYQRSNYFVVGICRWAWELFYKRKDRDQGLTDDAKGYKNKLRLLKQFVEYYHDSQGWKKNEMFTPEELLANMKKEK